MPLSVLDDPYPGADIISTGDEGDTKAGDIKIEAACWVLGKLDVTLPDKVGRASGPAEGIAPASAGAIGGVECPVEDILRLKETRRWAATTAGMHRCAIPTDVVREIVVVVGHAIHQILTVETVANHQPLLEKLYFDRNQI